MSAFLCTDKHIATLVCQVSAMLYSPVAPDKVQPVCDLLKRENIRSVNYRYSDRIRMEPVDLSKAESKPYSLRQLILLAKCLKYQSCERPDYEESKADHMLSRILAFLLSNLPEVESGLATCETWSI